MATNLQSTLSANAAAVAETQGAQKETPTVIANPTGGATVDAEARAAIVSILTLLRDQGITTAS